MASSAVGCSVLGGSDAIHSSYDFWCFSTQKTKVINGSAAQIPLFIVGDGQEVLPQDRHKSLNKRQSGKSAFIWPFLLDVDGKIVVSFDKMTRVRLLGVCRWKIPVFHWPQTGPTINAAQCNRLIAIVIQSK